MILGHYGLVGHRVWSSGAAPVASGGPLSPPARPQGEEERSRADHPGNESGSDNFWEILKIINFQNALFPRKLDWIGFVCLSLTVRRRLRWE